MIWQSKSFPSQIWKMLFEPFSFFSSIYLESYWKGLNKFLHSEEWGQLERGVVRMRVSLCGLRTLAILKATLYFIAEKVHFKLEEKIIAFFKSMCCPSSRIQRIFKHRYNPLREKWKWGCLIILNNAWLPLQWWIRWLDSLIWDTFLKMGRAITYLIIGAWEPGNVVGPWVGASPLGKKRQDVLLQMWQRMRGKTSYSYKQQLGEFKSDELCDTKKEYSFGPLFWGGEANINGYY